MNEFNFRLCVVVCDVAVCDDRAVRRRRECNSEEGDRGSDVTWKLSSGALEGEEREGRADTLLFAAAGIKSRVIIVDGRRTKMSR
jgi:hypothetical protein